MRKTQWAGGKIARVLAVLVLAGVLQVVQAQQKQYFAPLPDAGAFLKSKSRDEYVACPVIVTKELITAKGAIYAAVQAHEPGKLMVHRLDKFGDAKRNWEVKLSANEPVIAQVGSWSDFSEPGGYYFIFESSRRGGAGTIEWVQISGAKDAQSVIKSFRPDPRTGQKFELIFELVRNSNILMEVSSQQTVLAKGPRNAAQEYTEKWDATTIPKNSYTVTLEATTPNGGSATRTVMVTVK